MPIDVRVPSLGESVVEATVGAWLKHEGEAVEAGEPLVQLETEKVNVDVAADQSGVLGSVAAREGDTVHPGDLLATIDASARRSQPAALEEAPLVEASSAAPGEAPVQAPVEGRVEGRVEG